MMDEVPVKLRRIIQGSSIRTLPGLSEDFENYYREKYKSALVGGLLLVVGFLLQLLAAFCS